MKDKTFRKGISLSLLVTAALTLSGKFDGEERELVERIYTKDRLHQINRDNPEQLESIRVELYNRSRGYQG